MATKVSQNPDAAILVVEDDPDICMVLTDLLRIHGHHVDAVGTGTDAVDRVSRYHFDAVLLDVGLPDIGRSYRAQNFNQTQTPPPHYHADCLHLLGKKTPE